MHVCRHKCHGAHVEVGGQYDGVSFSVMWVPGIEYLQA